MYFKSSNKAELEAYANAVDAGEGYSGNTTTWKHIYTHKDGNQFAILKNENYPSEMQEIESLEGWFETQEEI